MHATYPKSEAIQEITRRLVDYFQPERVYLFGSTARSEEGPDSDLDFCVLPENAPESVYRDRTFHRQLWDLQTAVDIVRLPSKDFDLRAEHVLASLPATVIREGRLLYDSRIVAA